MRCFMIVGMFVLAWSVRVRWRCVRFVGGGLGLLFGCLGLDWRGGGGMWGMCSMWDERVGFVGDGGGGVAGGWVLDQKNQI